MTTCPLLSANRLCEAIRHAAVFAVKMFLTTGTCATAHAAVTPTTASRPPVGDHIPSLSMMMAVRASRVIVAVAAMTTRASGSTVRSSPAMAAVGAVARNSRTRAVRTPEWTPASSRATPSAPANPMTPSAHLVKLGRPPALVAVSVTAQTAIA